MGEIQQDGLPLPRRNWAMAVIALGMTMAVLDGAIANVALPTIAGDLHVNPSSSIWVVNAFQLAMTISLLAFSSLGDLWGYKRVYVLGLSMFTVTSLICALSDSFITLVIARGLQGFSAAAITSVNTALLRVIFPARFLARGMGINGLIIAVAAAAGPTVAAGILAIADWPWLFAINVPIGLVAFVLSLKFLPQNPVKVEGQRFDVTSAVMNALTFGLLICVIDGFAHDIHWYILIPGFVIMLIIGWFFIKRQKMRHSESRMGCSDPRCRPGKNNDSRFCCLFLQLILQLLQRFLQFIRTLVTRFFLLFHTPADDPVKHPIFRFIPVFRNTSRRIPTAHKVEQRTDRVHVRPAVQWFPCVLFRRRKTDRSVPLTKRSGI